MCKSQEQNAGVKRKENLKRKRENFQLVSRRCLVLTKAGRAPLLSQAGMKYLCTAQHSPAAKAKKERV